MIQWAPGHRHGGRPVSLSAASLLFQRHFAGHPLLVTAAAACENYTWTKAFCYSNDKKKGAGASIYFQKHFKRKNETRPQCHPKTHNRQSISSEWPPLDLPVFITNTHVAHSGAAQIKVQECDTRIPGSWLSLSLRAQIHYSTSWLVLSSSEMTNIWIVSSTNYWTITTVLTHRTLSESL